jgi:hypothetical protein
MKPEMAKKNQRPTDASLPVEANPVLVDSIKAGISKLKLVNLRDALKARGLKTSEARRIVIKPFKSLRNDVVPSAL